MSRDLNPLMDTGCGRNFGRIQSAAALCISLGISLDLHPLDCEPFFPGYGMNCSDAKIVLRYRNYRSFIFTALASTCRAILLKEMDFFTSAMTLCISLIVSIAKKSSLSLQMLETLQLCNSFSPIYNVDIDGVVRTFLKVIPSQQNSFSGQIVSCIFRFA